MEKATARVADSSSALNAGGKLTDVGGRRSLKRSSAKAYLKKGKKKKRIKQEVPRESEWRCAGDEKWFD